MAAKTSAPKVTTQRGSSNQTSPVLLPAAMDQGGIKILHQGSKTSNPSNDASVPRGEMARLFALQHWNSQRLEELASKVSSTPRMTREWSDDTLYDTGAQGCPKKETRSYQASVSDSTEFEDEEYEEEYTPTSTASSEARNIPQARSTAQWPPYTRPAANIPASPVPAPRQNSSLPPTPLPSPPSQPTVRFSDRNPISLHNRTSKSYYPHKASPAASSPPAPAAHKEAAAPHVSPVDAKWGALFNDRGEPTPRMASVLRGLASYIIVTYKPAGSLVITPEKLLTFYTAFQLENETIELTRFFACPSAEAIRNLEDLYLDLQCEYHLVQDRRAVGVKPRASVPALTPHGFVKWMLFLIRAFPDKEATRLDAVVSALPLEAITLDGFLERLPRQISRRLLPGKPHGETLRLVTQATLNWGDAMATDNQEKARPPTVSYRRDSRSRDDRDGGRERDRGVFVEVPSSSRRHKESCSRDRKESQGRSRDLDESRSRERSSRPRLVESEEKAGRHSKSYRRENSPRRSKRYERESKDDGGKERRRRYTIDGSDTRKSSHRRRDSRSGW